MMPLQWPDFYKQPTSNFWSMPMFISGVKFRQIRDHLERELLARPHPDPRVWGDDPLRIRMGLLVSKRIQGNYDWPNDHFLPEDPFDVVTLLPWDDLEVVELMMALEADLNLKISDDEAVTWAGATLSAVVDRLLTLTQKHML